MDAPSCDVASQVVSQTVMVVFSDKMFLFLARFFYEAFFFLVRGMIQLYWKPDMRNQHRNLNIHTCVSNVCFSAHVRKILHVFGKTFELPCSKQSGCGTENFFILPEKKA